MTNNSQSDKPKQVYSVNDLIRDISNTVASGWDDIQADHSLREINFDAGKREDYRISLLERNMNHEERVLMYLTRTPINSKKALTDFVFALEEIAKDTLLLTELLVNRDDSGFDGNLVSKLRYILKNLGCDVEYALVNSDSNDIYNNAYLGERNGAFMIPEPATLRRINVAATYIFNQLKIFESES